MIYCCFQYQNFPARIVGVDSLELQVLTEFVQCFLSVTASVQMVLCNSQCCLTAWDLLADFLRKHQTLNLPLTRLRITGITSKYLTANEHMKSELP